MKTRSKTSHPQDKAVDLDEMALTKLTYINPKTGNEVGYSRAHSLGLIKDGIEVINPESNVKFKLNVSGVMKQVKKSMLKYLNPKTGKIIGYFRAVELHLTTNPDVKFGLVNPKTGKMVGVDAAYKLGLIKKDMLRHAA